MRCSLIGMLCLVCLPVSAQTTWRGHVAAEYRYFWQQALDAEQRDGYPSLTAQPELRVEWPSGRDLLTVIPFYRWDRYDDQRRHADIREANWLHVGNGFETLIGVGKVFWGVTESQHLVDVINQTDLVESPDGEDKLGQPMFSAKLFSSMGTWNVFVLPYFRERTFPGQAGRLRTQPRVDTQANASYESSREQLHTDYALRWQQIVGVWDVGLSHFYGTNREPQLVPATGSQGEAVLLPFYELMHQTGLDVQATLTNWLLKLEAIHRSTATEVFNATTSGFEYTFFGVLGSAMDVGLLAEYLYDSRGDDATAPFQDDIMLGVRMRANDIQGTEVLLAMIADRRSSARYVSLEASRRLTDRFRLNVEARAVTGVAAEDPLYSLRQDDYLQIELAYHF